ncbi:MAG: deoxyguanosinetriphosphate triphosphohydrolase [Rhizobiaceae bacterium]|nr:deoxyguanosinetriphosphate triphosphohydrolase [Rhizobiaceae bacterium]
MDKSSLGFGSGERAIYASDPTQSRGRLFDEGQSLTRSPFQRDRDRIVHSTAFRRLKHKTQVFIAHEGDHYRTRLTHTIEVSQIARALARALKLDEDLAEGVALVHDFGHTPFGHTGEDALDALLKDYGGFDHNAQSLRIVTKLEQRYAEFDGLNLSWESLEGLVKHNGPLIAKKGEELTSDVPVAITNYNQLHDLWLWSFASLEAQAAAIADDIAYNTHDIDDGLRSGLLTHQMLEEVPFLAGLMKEVKDRYPNLDESRLTHEVTRRQITQMVEDVIGTAQENLALVKPKSADDVRHANQTIVGFSDRMSDIDKQLKTFLFANVYRHPSVMEKRDYVSKVVDQLFEVFMNDPQKMEGARWVDGLEMLTESARARHVGDYLSGMTDTYALDVHKQLFGAS